MRQRIEDWDWLDLRAYVRHAPESSALYKATRPDHWVTPELAFLRDVEYHLAWLHWAKTTDSKRSQTQPKPVPLTTAERKAAKPEREKYNAKPIRDTLAFLGWAKRDRHVTTREEAGRGRS